MICKNCGFTNSDDSSYCVMCGEGNEPTAEPVALGGELTCPSCGADNNTVATFCRRCGEKISPKPAPKKKSRKKKPKAEEPIAVDDEENMTGINAEERALPDDQPASGIIQEDGAERADKTPEIHPIDADSLTEVMADEEKEFFDSAFAALSEGTDTETSAEDYEPAPDENTGPAAERDEALPDPVTPHESYAANLDKMEEERIPAGGAEEPEPEDRSNSELEDMASTLQSLISDLTDSEVLEPHKNDSVKSRDDIFPGLDKYLKGEGKIAVMLKKAERPALILAAAAAALMLGASLGLWISYFLMP